MIIAIDVGNTVVSLGFFRGNRLVLKTSVPTKRCGNEFGGRMARLIRNDRFGLSAVVASVVPGVDKIIKRDLRRLKIKYRFIKPSDSGIPIRCREPEKVGADRLLNAVTAHKIYKKGAIVVDCGTATTFDAVSPRGEYLGGAIAPGLGIGSEALAQRCAKLFSVRLAFPRRAVGRDTKEAMLSGIVLGHIAMIEGMVARLRKELKFKPVIIGTGGFINLIRNRTKIFDVIDPDLTLKGLMITARK